MHRHVALQRLEEAQSMKFHIVGFHIFWDSDVGWLQLIMLLFHLGLGKECKGPVARNACVTGLHHAFNSIYVLPWWVLVLLLHDCWTS